LGGTPSRSAAHDVPMILDTDLEQLRFPIGRFTPQAQPSADELRAAIDAIAALPAAVRAAVDGLAAEQLAEPYRPGGWSLRQVVHHLPDSHMNAYIRFKLAMTETEPVIKPYDEAAWAELGDARAEDVTGSLQLLDALHGRWTHFLRTLAPADFQRVIVHPELGRITLAFTVQLYAWHGRHHLAHITALRQRRGW
jgi:hypothetical protein